MANNFSNNLRRIAHLILSSIVLVTVLFLPNTISAQKNGQITGRVFDSATKEYLPGANVMLKGTSYGTATDRSGEFRILNISPGNYELVVSYIGYESKSVELVIGTQGFTVKEDIGLKASDFKMKEIEISGLLQGQTKAINTQKTSEKIISVVSNEQIEKFPDINAAEVLQRLPGVNITRDQGEGRYVQIRGTEPRLNLIKINGEVLPSPEAKIRQVQMDIIPSDQLAALEVTKAITPDMDGNSIGGSVNMITKSAFDKEKTDLHLTLGSGYINLTGKYIKQGSLNFSTLFGDNKWGLNLSASYHNADRASQNNQMVWNQNVKLVNGTTIPWALGDLQLRDYVLNRMRLGFTGAVDFRPDADNKYSLKAIYNRFDDDEYRHRMRVRPSSGTYNSTTSLNSTRYEYHLRDRRQEQTLYSLNFTGENRFGNLTLDYSAAYSYSEELEGKYLATNFRLDRTFATTLNLSDPNIPLWNQTATPGYEFDPSKYYIDGMEWRKGSTNNKDLTLSSNIKFPYSISEYQGNFKAGAKVSIRNKNRTPWIWSYVLPSATASRVYMSRFSSNYKPSLDYLAGSYNWIIQPGPLKIWDFFNAERDKSLTGTQNFQENVAGRYHAYEDVYAIYAMSTLNLGKLLILAGVRDEFTQLNYTSYELLVKSGVNTSKEVKTDKNYNDILPMVHLNYKPDENLNLRAAFTTGIARPDFFDLAPYKITTTSDSRISLGNPELVATKSTNLDFMAEYYFSGIGLATAGVFYKSLNDIIYTSTYKIVGGEFNNFEVLQNINGGKGTILGFEVSWQQQLSFLPGFLDGLGLYFNYTYTKSTAEFTGRDGSTLPGQAGNVANFALSYQKYGFTGQVSLNYHSKYIFIIGKDADNDIYYKEHLQLDINANQEIYKGLSVYLQLMNLNNAPLHYYQGETSRPTQREFYSWWLQSGIKFSL